MAAEDFARVVRDAGLTRVELAQLYGVSRQTIHYWIKTAPPREGSYTARMAAVITAAILKAVEKRVLPFAAVAPDVRARRIESMVKRLQALSPAPK